MGHSEEYSRFLKMYSLLDIPWSTVSGFIGIFKHLGKVATRPRSRRPCKVTWVLMHIVYKSYKCSADSTAEELQIWLALIWAQTLCGGNFMDRVSMLSSYMQASNQQVQYEALDGCYKTCCHWNLFWWANHTFLVDILMEDSGFGGCQGNVMLTWLWVFGVGIEGRGANQYILG